MSTSSEIAELSGQKPLKMQEKPSFSQKCSMLSQYLKENGSFGDLCLGMTCNMEQQNETPEIFRQTASTMNFFPIVEKSRNTATPRDVKSMNLFPQQSGFGPSHPKEVPHGMSDSCVNKSAPAQPEKAQMTIFYGGQVIVFNDFPAEKAKEVMLLASKESPQSHATYPCNPVSSNGGAFPSQLSRNSVDSGSSIPPNPNVVPNFGNQTVKDSASQPNSGPIVCDLPIARKASLHRFLEKRKDRIGAKAPYQISSPAAAPAKQAESKSWLGLAAQSTQ
ncbi:protein TIFY 10A [Ziziphus jujuba]|uniref:Protein TIFY n=1 Tax=Ziziphus jujuba TaxID=326968 RepID=A0A6P4A6I7_ZIZJJ|nr:protein TIFY 10A [Ziziphus jujuba]